MTKRKIRKPRKAANRREKIQEPEPEFDLAFISDIEYDETYQAGFDAGFVQGFEEGHRMAYEQEDRNVLQEDENIGH
ncbi:hypothetical protein [Cohnella caldifontis]|uniref:hypothetical protein n=1 Tax=Cohnella caldifontis TaxID=3027471 RepID=UPI0023ED27E6|nr:hypothetical protein [Cohnella sp. YIM B05605]